jgi:hypothetical protein
LKRSNTFFAFGALFVVAAAGCQVIAGIQTRGTDPIVTGCTLPGVQNTPSTGNGKIRLVNLATSGGNADFCVRTSGTSWGRPLFRDGGDDGLCRAGLKYQQSTVPFSVPVGKIDVKAIPAGKTCDAAATSEVDGVAVADTTVAGANGAFAPAVTLARFVSGGAEKLVAHSEELVLPNTNTSAFRVVNVLASGKAINVGIAADAFVPSVLTSIGFAQPIPSGGVEAQGTGSIGTVDSVGYLNLIPSALELGISAADDPSNAAIVVFQTPRTADVATLYVVGDATDNAHPVHGLYCEDAINLATAIATGVAPDAGTSAFDAGLPLTSQDDALLAECTPTKPPLISVDSINAGLYGANAPYSRERAPGVYSAIAARTSDVMCVVEVDDVTDRNSIAAAAMTQYPYSYSLTTGLDTAPTLAADVNPAPTLAPCDTSIVPSSVLDKIYSCVNAKCANPANDPTYAGILNQSTACLTNYCATAFLPIYHMDLAINGCFDCVVLYMSSEQKLSDGRTACTTDVRQPFAFLGQTPQMILSHYPLSNQHAYVLPASGFRRAVLQATVTLENNQKFDVFCAQLSSPLIDTSLPYVGYYGTDNPPTENGWEDEQDLQIKEAIAFIKQQTAADGLPAVITGDWHSTAPIETHDAGTFETVSPEVISALEQAPGFVEASPPGWVPSCDYCADSDPVTPNPYNPGITPAIFTIPFLSGFPPNSTQSRTHWGIDPNAVTIMGSPSSPPPPSGRGPISEYFPTNVTILRPPTK